MAKATPGWFTDPSDSARTRWWNGWGWTGTTHPKSTFTQACIDKGLKVPDYDSDPENIPEGLVINNAFPGAPEPQTTAPSDPDKNGWFRITHFPGSPRIMCWIEHGKMPEYFDMNAVIEALVPDFIINGGTPDLVERWNSNTLTPQESDVVHMLMSRITPEKVKAIAGDSAPEYNNGPRWVTEPGNPSIANWWDGEQFTGQRELSTVISQREFDDRAAVIETVSHVDPPAGGKPNWWVNPENDTEMIHWGGLRWDRRSTLESMITERFKALSEQVPPQWAGTQRATPRFMELMEQLVARTQGVDGWYKEPHRFDDLSMRYWAQGAWTEHTSAQSAGWFDDPWNNEFNRYWDGQQWSDKTKSKEAVRIREEKAQARKAAIGGFALSVMENYAARNTPEMKRQQKIDAANDHSRRLRDAAASEQERFYRDRQKSWWK
jgi:hypothetical protein